MIVVVVVVVMMVMMVMMVIMMITLCYVAVAGRGRHARLLLHLRHQQLQI